MLFMIGAGLLAAAVVALTVGQIVFNRDARSERPAGFGPAEGIAFLITTGIVGGVTALLVALDPGFSGFALLELLGLVAAVGVVSTLLRMIFVRSAAAVPSLTMAMPGSVPPHDRRGRSDPEVAPADALQASAPDSMRAAV